jgi:hypothetical protein
MHFDFQIAQTRLSEFLTTQFCTLIIKSRKIGDLNSNCSKLAGPPHPHSQWGWGCPPPLVFSLQACGIRYFKTLRSSNMKYKEQKYHLINYNLFSENEPLHSKFQSACLVSLLTFMRFIVCSKCALRMHEYTRPARTRATSANASFIALACAHIYT